MPNVPEVLCLAAMVAPALWLAGKVAERFQLVYAPYTTEVR